jgi:hypothetical protein
LLLDATQALKCVFDRVDPFLKDDLLRNMIELLAGEPAPMRQRPVAAAAVNPAMPEEEREKLLVLSSKVVRRGLASPRKIPDSLMSRIGRPDSRKLTRSIKDAPAFRRLVLIRSPARFGISAGATTMQSCPSTCTWRQSPYPVGPASKQRCSRSYRFASLLIVRSIGAGLFSTSPINRTSRFGHPPRSPRRASSWRHRKPRKLRYTFPWSALRA